MLNRRDADAGSVAALLAIHRSYWDVRQSGSPLVEVAYAPPDVYHTPPLRGLRAPADGYLTPDALDPEAYWRHLRGSALPSMGALWPTVAPLGLPWMAAIIGCRIYCKRSDPDLLFMGDMWAEPIAASSSALLKALAPVDDSPWYHALLALTCDLVDRVGSTSHVTTTLLRGPVDMLGQALGDECMAIEFLDHPEETRQALEMLTDIWVRVNRDVMALIPGWQGGTVNGYGLWAPGITVRSQEDHAAILSPRTYRAFLLEVNRRAAGAFDYLLMHEHSGTMSDTLGRLDALLEVEALGAIQVTRDINSPPMERLLAIYARIQRAKPVVIWGAFTCDEIRRLLDALEPRGLCIKARAESWTEYHRIADWLTSQGLPGF